jgi:hypothetical protein
MNTDIQEQLRKYRRKIKAPQHCWPKPSSPYLNNQRKTKEKSIENYLQQNHKIKISHLNCKNSIVSFDLQEHPSKFIQSFKKLLKITSTAYSKSPFSVHLSDAGRNERTKKPLNFSKG